jgi:hypothetical protein
VPEIRSEASALSLEVRGGGEKGCAPDKEGEEGEGLELNELVLDAQDPNAEGDKKREGVSSE